MNCDQARDMLLDRLDGAGDAQISPDLDLHLSQCAACQQWQGEQLLAASALERLAPVPVPPDLTARVLEQVRARQPKPTSARPQVHDGFLNRLRRSWTGLIVNLGRPGGRRRLAPALMTVVAGVLVAFGLLVILGNEHIAVTPGAAIGESGWPILGGGLVVIALVVLVFLLSRRK